MLRLQKIIGGVKKIANGSRVILERVRWILFVDQPEQVSVVEIGGENSNILELSVAKSDMGKIIGKQGRDAQVIRTILNAASGKTRKKYVLEIVE